MFQSSRTICLTVAALAGALAMPSAAAAHSRSSRPRPIVTDYNVQAQPDPTTYRPVIDPDGTVLPGCGPSKLGHDQARTITLPAAGTFVATLSGYLGDWDLCLRDATGAELLDASFQDARAKTEQVRITVRRRTRVQVIAQNSIGGPTAHVHATFTFH